MSARSSASPSHLASLGLSAPAILAADPRAGLVLEEDFGDALFAALLDQGADPAPLFDAAIDALAVLQRAPAPKGLPAWDARAMIAATLDPLLNWWWPAAFGAAPPPAARAEIEAALAATLAPLARGPRVTVHRDFFAGNLVWLPERAGPARVGLLDFQGAAIGSPAYDLVSLVQDARRDLPPELAERGIARLLAARPDLDPEAFRAAFAICAAQRHLRVATQWVRLARRDQRPALSRAWPAHLARCSPRRCAIRKPRRSPPRSTAGSRPTVAPRRRRRVPRRARSPRAPPWCSPPASATRMRPLTEATAKPLLPLGGHSLLDHALDRLAAVGVDRVAVNAFWQADRVAAALAARTAPPRTELLREATLLDTGGGVRAALDRLGPDPFFVVNGDAFWLDGPAPALARLADAFARAEVDAVLLVHRTCQVRAEVGPGDFVLDPWGTPRRRGEREIAPYVFAGVQLIAPAPAGRHAGRSRSA